MPEPTELFKVIRTAIDQADHANPASFDTMASHVEFAVNNYFSDEGNEGMKHERMVKAAAAISILYPDRTADWDKLKAIIEEAQG